MACRRCGSAWVTHGKGLDMLSCPECCKQQRVKARKQGRMPKEIVRPCDICGKQMTISGSAICSTKYCEECRPQARRNRVEKCRERAKRGDPPRTTKERSRAQRDCLNCGSKLHARQKKYCSPACFVAARNSGVQSWDRTGQLEANVKRCGIQLCPSKQGLSGVLNGFTGFMAKLRAFNHEFQRMTRRCRRCDELLCNDVGEKTTRFCSTCRRHLKSEARKRHKKESGNHRKRCRKGGGHLNPGVRRKKVFERDAWRCHVCRVRCNRIRNHPKEATLDHFPVPLSKGGDHDWHNVRCACRRCNSLRSDSWDGQAMLPLRGASA